MKVTTVDVLSKVDNLCPNNYTRQQKQDWLYTAEAQIRDFAAMYTEDDADKSFVQLHNATLTLEQTDMDIYVHYVLSMIHMANNDIAMYNNHTAMFNTLMLDWQKKHRRSNTPPRNTCITY